MSARYLQVSVRDDYGVSDWKWEVGAGVHLDRRFRRQRTRKAAFAAALG